MHNQKIIESNKAIATTYHDAFVSKKCTWLQDNNTVVISITNDHLQSYNFNFKFDLETIMPDNLFEKLETIYKLSDILKQITYIQNVHIESHTINVNDISVTIQCKNSIELTFKLLENDAVEYQFQRHDIIDEPIDIIINKQQRLTIEPTIPSQQLKCTIHEIYRIDYINNLAYTIDHEIETRYKNAF